MDLYATSMILKFDLALAREVSRNRNSFFFPVVKEKLVQIVWKEFVFIADYARKILHSRACYSTNRLFSRVTVI